MAEVKTNPATKAPATPAAQASTQTAPNVQAQPNPHPGLTEDQYNSLSPEMRQRYHEILARQQAARVALGAAEGNQAAAEGNQTAAEGNQTAAERNQTAAEQRAAQAKAEADAAAARLNAATPRTTPEPTSPATGGGAGGAPRSQQIDGGTEASAKSPIRYTPDDSAALEITSAAYLYKQTRVPTVRI